MHRNRKPCNSFLVVNIGSELDHRHVTMTFCNMVAILQLDLIGRLRHTNLVYSVHPGIHLPYWTSILWSIDTCQNKISTDHITGSGVYLIEARFFLKLTTDQELIFFIVLQARVRLTSLSLLV